MIYYKSKCEVHALVNCPPAGFPIWAMPAHILSLNFKNLKKQEGAIFSKLAYIIFS